MAERLSLISRNPRFRSAFNGAIAAIFITIFLASGEWPWFAAYAIFILVAYFRSTLNASHLFSLALVQLLLPAASYGISYGAAAPFFGVVLGATFAVMLGAKNLILTHRERWVAGIAYCLAYLSFLSFFAFAPMRAFFWMLAFVLISVICAVRAVSGSYRVAVPIAFVMGGALWALSLLPIGFVSSANAALAFLAFMHGTAHERRFRADWLLAFVAILLVIAVTSQWQL